MNTVPTSDEFLYIFVHIPKTAGTTFHRHLWHNFGYKSLLEISPKPSGTFRHRAEIDEYIDSLPPERKDQIRVISGHGVYYGIHEHFRREPRYLTFLRDPIERTISSYNFLMGHYADFLEELEEFGDRLPQRREKLTFDRWCNNFQQNVQVGVILNYRVDNKYGCDPDLRLSDSHLEEAKRVLDDFYFVGLTETFEEDSLFLYNELNVTRFLRKKQNVTNRRYVEVNEELIETIRAGMAPDLELYDHARNLNREFKKSHPDFCQIVERVRDRGRYVISIEFLFMDTITALLGQRRTLMLNEWTVRMLKKMIRVVR